MRIRLTYRGNLRSGQKSNLPHIHDIRRCFHKQMKVCWKLPPLSENQNFLAPPTTAGSILEDREKFLFAPLITKQHHLLAKLDVLFLRAAAPGRLYGDGDLDNRVKTLVDALRMPTLDEVKSAKLSPEEPDERPFFCLLQNDALVTSLAVDTDYFLDHTDLNECLLVVSAELHTAHTTLKNLALV